MTADGVNPPDDGGGSKKARAYFQASQAKLIWWRFRRHKLAKLAVVVLCLLYLAAAFCEFLSPYGPETRFPRYKNAPPSRLRMHDAQTGWTWPFVYDVKSEVNRETFKRDFVPVTDRPSTIGLFCRGERYRLWGLFEMDIHLFGTKDAPIFLFGTDNMGYDIFSRTLYGARVSLSIGLVGVLLCFVLGVFIGGVSGYFGGATDSVIQRIIEFMLSLPMIPLWMALSAALPREWPVIRTYFFITLILSVLGWGRLAREVRGKLLSLRNEDYVTAARLSGSGEMRIIAVHLLPAVTSHLIVALTLAIPQMILGETALSFLGLGIQPPAVSWGVLLQDAQSVVALAHHPWKLIPCGFVVVTVLMFNFLGDGLRDAADPYG